MGVGTIGDTYIDRLLAEYTPTESNSIPQELVTDETDQLLFALLLELRAQRFAQGQFSIQNVLEQRTEVEQSGEPDKEANYRAESLSVDVPKSADDYEQLDLSFISSEIDLRFDDGIVVAFVEDQGTGDLISYDKSDSPVAGIPVSTSYVLLGAQSGTGGAVNVDIEIYGD